MSKLDTNVKDLILGSVVGDMTWHGETYADEVSLTNMEAAYQLVDELVGGIFKNATLPQNAVDTYSGAALSKRAKEMLEYIAVICDDAKQ